MDFHPPKFRALLLVMAITAMVLSANGQQSGQSIIFSSPQADDAQPAAPSLAPDNSTPATLPGTMPAPMSLFNYNKPNSSLPAPAVPVDSLQQQRMRKLLEERKNWALMTPEEILGVNTTENMLQPPDQDAPGREKNQTQLERYLERESRLRNGLTNDWQNDRASSPWNFLRERDNANSIDSGRENQATAVGSLNQLLSGQRNQDDSANQNGNPGWDAFSQPLPQPSTKPDPEQVAAMERFRQLLAPSPNPLEPSPDSKFFPVPRTVTDPFITSPDFVPNPAGASFTPLSSGLARPSGLTPLPGTVSSFSSSVTTPSWKPQPPPWLLQGPQPFVMPQPKGF